MKRHCICISLCARSNTKDEYSNGATSVKQIGGKLVQSNALPKQLKMIHNMTRVERKREDNDFFVLANVQLMAIG